MTEEELQRKIRQAEMERDHWLKQKKPIDLQLFQARKKFRLYSEELQRLQQGKAA